MKTESNKNDGSLEDKLAVVKSKLERMDRISGSILKALKDNDTTLATKIFEEKLKPDMVQRAEASKRNQAKQRQRYEQEDENPSSLLSDDEDKSLELPAKQSLIFAQAKGIADLSTGPSLQGTGLLSEGEGLLANQGLLTQGQGLLTQASGLLSQEPAQVPDAPATHKPKKCKLG